MIEITTTDISHCFALLDNADQEGEITARCYQNPRAMIVADQADRTAFLAELESQLSQGYEIVLTTDYHNHWSADEHTKASDLTPGSDCDLNKQQQLATPLRALIFDDYQILGQSAVENFLSSKTESANEKQQQLDNHAGVYAHKPNQNFDRYQLAIEKILEYIAAGDCYQINYTFPWHVSVYGQPTQLYWQLMNRQRVPYGALIKWPNDWVLSRSPELFFAKKGDSITTKPMKGTSAASTSALVNAQRSAALASDTKNKAENLMIVDLLRNDLGQIAEIGSVKVPHLFQVDQFGEVLQMTSTVTAKLPPKSWISTVFDALFPCGSITGAPKRRAMEIIQSLEDSERGLYTGNIGWLSPDVGSSWNACLSVVIRTIELNDELDGNGLRHGKMGIGSGIVADSDPDDEYDECFQKASFLTGMLPTVELIETMRAMRDDRGRYHIPLFNRHMQRVISSAEQLGFWPLKELEAKVSHYLNKLADDCAEKFIRIRLLVKPTGYCELSHSAFTVAEMVGLNGSKLRVDLYNQSICSADPLRQHKTTSRTLYNKAISESNERGLYDYIFYNQRGNLVEGAKTNIYLKLGNKWFTPPLTSGALPGVVRSALLDRGEIDGLPLAEANLSVDDYHQAEAIYTSNGFAWLVAVERERA